MDWEKGKVNAMNRSIGSNANVTAMAADTLDRRQDGRAQRRFRHATQEHLNREQNLRLEERDNERARIARELHDTLFQGFFGASMVLHNVVEAMPEDSPDRHSMGKALQVVRRVLEEGRAVLQGLRAPRFAPASVERELSNFVEGFSLSGVRCEISVTGTPRGLRADVQEQINLIGREALVNALLHSEATCIEVEVEYSPRRLRVMVRDNGRGIDPQVVRARRDAHWGLLGMRERAEGIGATLKIWSRPGAGTEVEILVPSHAFVGSCA
jgi:signal transduction histidine kinase